MKSDRRTLVLLGVMVLFLVVSVSFRSYFLYGARLITGNVSIDGTELLMTSDQNDPRTLGVWSTRFPDQPTDGNRDVQLGFTLAKMSENWNRESSEGREAIKVLEEFCTKNPDDLPAKAHLLRLALNINSLDKLRDKALLTSQAERLVKVASDGAVKEPMNWYWRERQVHFLSLVNREEEAIEKFTAKPFPNMFADYVEDDPKVRRAYLEASYLDLPTSNEISTWAGTIYPHLSSFRTFEELSKRPKTALSLRIADIEFGRALIRSCPTRIAVFVGLRHLRFGLWNSSRFGYTKNISNNDREEALVKPAYVAAMSDLDWQKVKKLAADKSQVEAPFLDPAEDLRALYVTRFGPILIAAGILTSIFGVGFFLVNRGKKDWISNDFARWIVLASGLLLGTSFLNKYRYFVHFSLQSPALYLLVVAMAIGALILIYKSDVIQKKVFYAFFTLIVLAIGFAIPPCQVGMVMVLASFLIQRGKMPLSPWLSAALIFILTYHVCLFAAFSPSRTEGILAFFFAGLGILLSSPRKLEIQQPRLAGLSVGLVTCLLGVFLMSYYDKSLVTFMQAELTNVQKMKRNYEGI